MNTLPAGLRLPVRWPRLAELLAAAVLLAHAAGLVAGPTLNGFDLGNASIPVSEIERGGPPRDGIPAIDSPRFIPASSARELAPGDRVLGLRLGGEARAYPVAILNWHEVVNDVLGGVPVAVTYCPLCGTGVAYRAEVAGRRLQFGVSGLLYNSDVLLYDRQTESLWSQILSRAVSGPMRDQTLTMIALEHTTWSDWRARHPDAAVLSRETGFARDYDRDPYLAYRLSDALMFGVSAQNDAYPAKTWVLGVELAGRTKAYPFPELAQLETRTFVDRIGDADVRIVFDPDNLSARAERPDGEALPTIMAYWFAWFAFHPQTEVFRADTKGEAASTR